MKRKFDFIRGYERDLIEKDRLRNQLFNSMWNMKNLIWDFSDADKAKMKNIRTLVDTSPSDALNNAALALSNTIPRWDVSPYGSSLYEFQRTEKLEHCLQYTFNKMNQRGTGTLLFDKMYSSLLYDMIVTRIDDLEFQFKGTGTLTPLQKYIRSKGRFFGQVFDARGIHCEFSMGTFTSLLHVEEMRAWDVYNYWKMYENNTSKEGRMVAEALRKMDAKFAGKNTTQTKQMKFVFYEFYSHDQVLKHGHFIGGGGTAGMAVGNEHNESSPSDIIFADEENTLGFINWSVRVGGSRIETEPAYQVNPMLAPLHWGNSWETINILRSLVMSEPIKRMLEEPRELHTTKDGRALPVNEDGIAAGYVGEGIQKLGQSPLDPNAPQIVQQLQQEIVRTTGANVLSDVTSAKTTPFATLNAMIQVAMSRLDVNRRDGALSCADDAAIILGWVEKTGKPLMSYRKTNKTMNLQGYMMQMMAGEMVVIQPGDYNLEHCDIAVDIKPKTPTDFQQQILSAIQLHDKLQLPLNYLLERFVGIDNVDLLRNQYEDELFHNAEVQAAVQNIAQQEAMRMQQQQQAQMGGAPQGGMGGEPTAQPPQPGGISQGAMGALGDAGGSPQFMPSATREMSSGATQGGEAMAAGG